MPVELLVDEDNHDCENSVESAGYPDVAVDGTFGKAESEGPSGFQVSFETSRESVQTFKTFEVCGAKCV